MTYKNTILFLFIIVLGFSSCKKDDEETFIPAPVRDRAEQQITDKDSLLNYLQTHYYNSSAFTTPGNYSYTSIIINELPRDEQGNYEDLPDPTNNTLLIDAVETLNILIDDVDYEYYVLRLNQGGGDNPNFTDDIRINYSGNFLDGEVFDNTVNADTPLDLTSVVRGWRDVLTNFNTAVGLVENPDGTSDFDNYGFGVMFLPSGLGYFASPPPGSGIPAYANLVFKFELYQSGVNDHDNDGILSHLEDLNNNLDVFDDNTDGDTLPNFFDTDDDNDGVPTIFEDIDNDGDPSNDDTDGDGIPNYLDASSTQSNQEEDN
ncbi:hypothetical protein [uncultured Psychroserpens sp.]|uniref:FKBP-type peptidyl-prolyl cis-trans isomerase n=1 Tax=uncultured Psychroserpens sp. TaxID=255436 RepID=UPI0026198101|nr:hypothetical protein [uncultured Psychroserpens sp.]